jgi:phage terminase large subunit GpA-like protein
MKVADGAQIVREAARAGLRPDPNLRISEWADQHRSLTPRSSPEPGKWRTSRTPFLRAIMDDLSPMSPVQQVVFMKGSQIGGPLALDTPVATTEGWKTMETLDVGDRVFDENGQPCWVTGISPVFQDHECYRLRFSDGSELVADAGHRWQVWRKLGAMREELCTRTTAEMLMDYRYEKGNGNEHRYSIDLIGPLVLEPLHLPIDPYLLGYWLGNGAARQNNAAAHSDDAAEIAGYLRDSGVTVEIQPVKGRTALLTLDGGRKLEHTAAGRFAVAVAEEESYFPAALRALGLSNNKQIPREYLRASFSQRLALLQGLMDSDGSCELNGGCCFSTSNPVLRDAVFELVVGLGLKPTVGETPAKTQRCRIRGRVVHSKVNWRIRFLAYSDIPVFRLRRKLERQRPRSTGQPTETGRRRIVAITRIASVPVRCIAVSSDSHLFAAGKSLIVTHNTECGNNWIGYVIHLAPGPMMAVQPTTEMAKRNSKQRIAPLIDECAPLRGLVREARSRDSGNTVLAKEFPGGVLVMVGANSAKGLRSMSARYLFLDEVDGYPGDVDGEGEPCALAMARVTNFARRKVFIVSTPVISGRSRIERFYDASDQRQYWVPCPWCSEMMVLEIQQLRWPKGKPEQAKYYCEACARGIEDWQKDHMLSAGAWRPQRPESDTRVHGYHLSSLYSPVGWLSWPQIAQKREEAGADVEKVQVFTNTILGRPWADQGEVPDTDRLYERREHYPIGIVPEGGLLLTAGADVQLRRIEVEVVAWGRDRQSWSVDYRVLEGDTNQPAVWSKLERLLEEDFPTAYGQASRIQKLAVDTGFNTMACYDFVRKMSPARVMGVKGDAHTSSFVGSPSLIEIGPMGRKLKYGVRLWPVNTFIGKEELYRWLKTSVPDLAAGEAWPVGFCHFPAYSKEYFEQLTAEHLITRTHNGVRRSVWEKIRDRNEALDCRIYARAAAASLRIETWAPARWDQLEASLLVERAAQESVRRPATESSPVPQFKAFKSSDSFLD